MLSVMPQNSNSSLTFSGNISEQSDVSIFVFRFLAGNKNY